MPDFHFYFSACTSGFQCSSGLCVSNSSICNGVNDCVDGTDERGCGKESGHKALSG